MENGRISFYSQSLSSVLQMIFDNIIKSQTIDQHLKVFIKSYGKLGVEEKWRRVLYS